MGIKVTGYLNVEVPFEINLKISRQEFEEMNHSDRDRLITIEELDYKRILNLCRDYEEVNLMREGLEVDYLGVESC